MAQTQRVLSGSRTKGSTATPSGSIIFSYQGVNARTTTSYFGSLLPRIGSGDRIKLFKDGKPISEKYFDDESTMNSDVTDMRAISGSIYETRIGFDLERMAFGQPPTNQLGEPFADIAGFNPVAYVTDPGHIMWPVNLWNVGALPDHEFDGVIEPLDIRRSILGEVDLRFEGHAPRGAVMGPYSENPFGSTKIEDTWQKSDKSLSPFFDGPSQMSRDRGRDIPVLARLQTDGKDTTAWTDPNSVLPYQGYQGLERELDSPLIQQDYHDVVYSQIITENPPICSKITQGYLTSNFTTLQDRVSRYDASKNLIAWIRMDNGPSGVAAAVEDSGQFVLSTTLEGASQWTTVDAYPMESTFWVQRMGTSIAWNGSNSAVYIDNTNNWSTDKTDSKTINDIIGGSADSNGTVGTLKNFSISVWLGNNSTTGTGAICMIGDSNGSGGNVWVSITSAGVISAGRFSAGLTAGGYEFTVTGKCGNSFVEHLAVVADFTEYSETGGTQDDTYIKIYINGALANTSPAKSGNLQGGDIAVNSVSIAGAYAPGYGSVLSDLTAQMGDFALFNKALSAEEIYAIYNAGGNRGLVIAQSKKDPMVDALQLLNSSSCSSLTDPLEKRAARGFYFGEKAGSIVYGDW